MNQHRKRPRLEPHRLVVISVLNFTLGLIAMTNTAGAAPTFNLKRPADYFADANSQRLLKAAMAGDIEQARQLVKQGANPNDEGPKDNSYNRIRLLHYAIAAGNASAVKTLVAVGADPELTTIGGGGRALLFAIQLNKLDMLVLLLDLKPVKSLKKKTVETLLFESVSLDRPKCLELLIQRGAPVDQQNGAGYTLLLHALAAQAWDLAELLMAHGASVQTATANGITPAYSIERHLSKYKVGSLTHKKLLRLKQLMEVRGANFPAISPQEVREKNG